MKKEGMVDDCLKMLEGSIRIIKLATEYKNYIKRYYPKVHDKAIKSSENHKVRKGNLK